jgi:hypothetical protein
LQKVAERKKAEEELISFMLDFIVRLQEGHTNYSQVSGQPWLNPPADANLIVFLPPNEEIDKKPWEQLKFDEPIKVWWFFDNKLVEATDNQEAIQKYEEYYMADARWPWRYQWGILSISDDNKKATMYVESSSCPECAGGMLYTLRRDDSGEWQIIDSELLWLS